MLLLAMVAVLACLAVPTAAVAEPCSSTPGGLMSFQAIQGPEDPEDYCWEVKLGEDQALRQINDREAEVYTTDSEEHHNFSITAVLAHDAEGVSVPTTLAVTEPNLITLTVHIAPAIHSPEARRSTTRLLQALGMRAASKASKPRCCR
ncbi:MAG TPA: hypothetical protein VFX35_02220 [Solirubrobacterales bacterium]|nr:hypothetical protein [Solirubrobacterales bacterium]